jgi:hypothetical protein
MATMAYGDFWVQGTGAATYAGYSSTVPVFWSSAVIEARTHALTWQRLPEPPRKGARRSKRPPTLARWGWQIARWSQGLARPHGYHGRHGKHPGYGPTGFRRLERLVARLKA